jgi:triosephosphate isomerase
VRKPIVAGNWKMNFTSDEAASLADQIRLKLADETNKCDVVLCPAFTSLDSVRNIVSGTKIGLGAQNMHWEESGAFTGDVSAGMILTSGCQYVILGHSERRQYSFESDADVKRKTVVALNSGLTPIICVGERLEQREANQVEEVVIGQVAAAVEDVDKAELGRVIIAYEPVWAIGTGRTATAAQAEEVHELIRRFFVKHAGNEIADQIRLQYGGSVKPDNAEELFSQKNIDGGLIGGAALHVDSFVDIVKAAK